MTAFKVCAQFKLGDLVVALGLGWAAPAPIFMGPARKPAHGAHSQGQAGQAARRPLRILPREFFDSGERNGPAPPQFPRVFKWLCKGPAGPFREFIYEKSDRGKRNGPAPPCISWSLQEVAQRGRPGPSVNPPY